MATQKQLIVNAIPLTRVHTGISRYLRCLYSQMEKQHTNELDIWYFDGTKLSRSMPKGPQNLRKWTRLTDMFWKLPWPAALALRLAAHTKTEHRFYKLARGFDLYHEAGFFPMQVPPGLRTLFTVHDISLLRFPEHHPRERVIFHNMFWRSRWAGVDEFLTVSRFSKQELQAVLPPGPYKITVTPLAHDPSVFYPRSRSQLLDFTRQHGLPPRYFLFVGSGDPRKNLPLIPKALHASGIDICLVVAGWSGWSQEQQPTNVHHAGYMSDEELALLYSGALALIFPSSYEGFGLPVLEAMACGCPVVTSQRASLPEVAADAACYVQNPEDIDELGRILGQIAQSPGRRQELRERGLARAAKFSWAQTARLTYATLMDASAPKQTQNDSLAEKKKCRS